MSDAAFPAERGHDLPPPGHALRAARNRSGLSIADVARHLKLAPAQVEALESDDHAHLPGPVFVRGFIRNYARLVNLDPRDLLQDVERSGTGPVRGSGLAAPSAPIRFSAQRPVQWRRYRRYASGLVLLAVVAAVALFEFYGVEGTAPATVGDKTPVTEPATPVPMEQEKPVSSDAPSTGAASEAAATPSVQVSDAAVAAPAESPAPSIVTKRVLKFRFPHEAWVQVRDSTGRTIVARLHAAGTERVVDGIPPFRVIIGKANGIQLFDNDQPVDLTRYISDDVARLTLK